MIQQALFGTARPMPQVDPDGLVVVLFCGGAGSSYGIRLATGRDPDFAVNHSASAIAMHQANHPAARHFKGDVWHARPHDVTRGRHVSLLWLSPTCIHFSQAKGGPLRDAKERALAWTALPWAREKADWIVLENVKPFTGWGRLKPNGKVDPKYKGHTFKTWLGKLKALGYRVEMRTLRGCDYGAPTTRDRLFIVANCIGAPIVWPEPTHGPGRAHPYRTAAECIDWSVPGKSIFERKKPLAKPTLKRIARSLHKHILSGDPFVVPGSDGSGLGGLVQTSYGERIGQTPRSLDLRAPLGTVVAGGVKHAVVVATVVKNYGGPSNGGDGIGMGEPLSTVTTQDHHSLVTATLVQYNGTSNERDIKAPLGTVTTRDRFGLVEAIVARVDAEHGVTPERRAAIRDLLALGAGDGPGDTSGVVTIRGEQWVIVDVTFRMLTPRELATAMGLPPDFVLDPFHEATSALTGRKVWRRLNLGEQVRCIGNMVVPQIVDALVRANVGQRAQQRAA